MDNISRVSLYRYGVKVCERNLLPFLIRRLEPLRDQEAATSALPEVEHVVTEYEVKETLRKYQVVDYLFKYGLFGALIITAYGLSKVFTFIPPILAVPLRFGPVLVLVIELAIFIFWLGVYMRMKSRWEEWLKIRNMEISLEKIEYYAKATSSTIIAQLLVDIERMKETQKQESEKARTISAMQSVMQSENMKTFEDMMDRRERMNKRKGRMEQLLFMGIGWVVGKGLDALPTLLSGNRNGQVLWIGRSRESCKIAKDLTPVPLRQAQHAAFPFGKGCLQAKVNADAIPAG
jgi:hypothetical protein